MGKPRTRTAPFVYKDGLFLLQEFFGLSSSTNGTCDHPDTAAGPSFDGLIISIDFENITSVRRGFQDSECCQMGIAVLDSRDISRRPANEAISTVNYATGTPKYIRRASTKHLFGDSISCHTTELAAHMRSYFPADDNRQIIIIGYSVEVDLCALRDIGFEFPAYSIFFVDIFRIAKDVISGWSSSLARLLDFLEVQYPLEALHCAGNDANLTLKAALLLVEREYSRRVPAPNQKDLETLAFIRDMVMGTDSRNINTPTVISTTPPPSPSLSPPVTPSRCI